MSEVVIRHAAEKEDWLDLQRIWNQWAGTHLVLREWDEETARAKASHPQRVSVVAEIDGKVRGFIICFWPETLENAAIDHEIADDAERDVIFYSLISATASACIKAGFRDVVRGVVAEDLSVADHMKGDLAIAVSSEERFGEREENRAEVFLVPLAHYRDQSRQVLDKSYKEYALYKAFIPVLDAFNEAEAGGAAE